LNANISRTVSRPRSGCGKRYRSRAAPASERLRAANVAVSLDGDTIRISPSIFNDERDIETLLDALLNAA
jgi:selenocysteine lyase/cysteine desulfurase